MGQGHDYEAIHGTQQEQARRQVVQRATADGPWGLRRRLFNKTLILPNSIRSSKAEIEYLKDSEFCKTGIVWEIYRYEQ